MSTIGDFTRARRNSPSGDPGVDRLDLAAIDHRLISMKKSIEQLESYGPLNTSLLEDKPAAGLVAERIMFFLADLAVEINGYLARGVAHRFPRGESESYLAAVSAGVIDAELVPRLIPDEGPHHVLLQLSLDSDPEAVEAIVAEALSAYGAYTQQVSAWVRSEGARG
ncbi:hypothetical protein LRP67_03130 [Nocardioides sp. cx-169]|uniref:hypothetical protein n=1 Tax=Nocardioides sp. cx-169 TaxID=2899080 RepID=UPI001E448512|nr:hypothetical protein [Nocardioides sp. cx-169]MCD4533073.1 hypothetical protein [Nocardioides sp. cx-169]